MSRHNNTLTLVWYRKGSFSFLALCELLHFLCDNADGSEDAHLGLLCASRSCKPECSAEKRCKPEADHAVEYLGLLLGGCLDLGISHVAECYSRILSSPASAGHVDVQLLFDPFPQEV